MICYSDFNPASKSYLTTHHGVQRALQMIHSDFETHQTAILSKG